MARLLECSFCSDSFRGSDSVGNELYVLHSLLNARAKIMKIWQKEKDFCGKVAEKAQFEGEQTAGYPLNDVDAKMLCLLKCVLIRGSPHSKRAVISLAASRARCPTARRSTSCSSWTSCASNGTCATPWTDPRPPKARPMEPRGPTPKNPSTDIHRTVPSKGYLLSISTLSPFYLHSFLWNQSGI